MTAARWQARCWVYPGYQLWATEGSVVVGMSTTPRSCAAQIRDGLRGAPGLPVSISGRRAPVRPRLDWRRRGAGVHGVRVDLALDVAADLGDLVRGP